LRASEVDTETPKIRISLTTASASALLLGLLALGGCGKPVSRSQGNLPVDRILVLKREHRLELLSRGDLIKAYQVALGRADGAKVMAGDHKTPQGLYEVDSKLLHSRFHKALHISYPNASDIVRARHLGVNPGGAIEIHGLPWYFAWVGGAQHLVDWTDGCIAVSNSQIDEIWKLVPTGTPVEIRP
jgi:murein L,D-transpeptidase YafK